MGRVEHKLLIGVDYSRSETNSQSAGFAAPPIDVYNPDYSGSAPTWPTDLTSSPESVLRQAGLYIQDQMKIADRWIVVAGLRHDKASTSTEGGVTDKDSVNSLRFGLMYQAPNGLSPYLSYSESFTPLASSPLQTFKPLRGEQWEAGIKYEPVGSKMSYNASVYEWKEKNRQVAAAIPDMYEQVGQAKTKGIELEARGELFRNFDMIAHYNYIDLDDQLEPMPHAQSAVWGKYRFSIGELPGFSVGAGARYMSSFSGNVAPTIDAVTLFDALLAWENPKWRVALNVANLTDKTYLATCLDRGDCWYGARRNAVLSATYRW
jgi:iron complex outermembrane recepter protein